MENFEALKNMDDFCRVIVKKTIGEKPARVAAVDMLHSNKGAFEKNNLSGYFEADSGASLNTQAGQRQGQRQESATATGTGTAPASGCGADRGRAGGMVTSGSSMPHYAVAAGAACVKGEPARGRSLRDP